MSPRTLRLTENTFRSLRTRNFRLFFGGQLISQVGNWLTMIAQTLLVLKLTDGGLALGILTACQFAPLLLLGAWSGLVADRSDKRKLLLVVQTLAMVQSFALAALAFTDDPPLLGLYALALVGGLTVAFDNPARRAFVVEMVEEEDVQNAVSLNTAVMTGSRIVGPALAGLLVTTVGYGWAFLGDGLSYIAVLAALWRMDTTQLRVAPVQPRGRGQIREGLRYIRSVPELRIPLLMMTVVGTLGFNFQVVIPLFVTDTLAGDDRAFTLLFSVLSAGSFVGALVAARRKTIDLRAVALACAGFGAALSVMAAAPSLVAAFPVAILVGFTGVAFMTTSTSIMQLRASPVMWGRVLALQAMVFLGSTPIGGPVLGWLCDLTSPRVGLLVGGVATLGAAAWGLSTARSSAPPVADEEVRLEPSAVGLHAG
jgi:MFS family permease